MKFLIAYARSSIGQKQLMGLTGLLWCGFLVGHLSGNFALLASAEAFNKYAHFLTSLGGLLYIMEAGLVITFLSHAFLGIRVSMQNKKARETNYIKGSDKGGSHMAARLMALSGAVTLIFVVLHLIQFKFGKVYMVPGTEIRDLYKTVMELYANPFFTLWYVIAMVLLGIHLTHALHSSLQSLGLNHPKYTPAILGISKFFGSVVAGGFIVISILAHLKGGA